MRFELNEIGVAHTPFTNIAECPGTLYGETASKSVIEVHEEYKPAIIGLREGDFLHVLWWACKADRTVLRCEPRLGERVGVFSSRCPQRPNPICLSRASITSISSNLIHVYGLECLNGTRVLDLKKCIAMDDGQWI